MRFPIRYKILSLILIVLGSMLLSTSAYFFWVLRINKKEILLRNHSLAADVARDLDDMIVQSRAILKTLARHPAVVKQESNVCDKLFAELLPSYTLNVNIIGARMDGSNFCSGLDFTHARELGYAEAAWFQHAVKGVSYVGDRHISRLTGSPIIMIAEPVWSGKRQVGAVAMPLHADWVREYLVHDWELPNGSSIDVTDSRGANLLCIFYRDGKTVENNETSSCEGREAPGPDSGEQKTGPDGIERLYSSAHVANGGLTVIVGVPMEKAFLRHREMLTLFVVVILTGSFLAAILGLLFSRRITKSILALTEGMSAIEQNDLDHRLTPGVNDELSDLALSFNRMAEGLKSAKQAFAVSEKKYRELVENAQIGIYQATRDGAFLYVNDAMARIFGFESTRDLLAQNLINRYKNPEDRIKFLQKLQEAGGLIGEEVAALARDGSERIVLLSASLTDGVISGMIKDITERKKAETALRDSEEKLRRSNRALRTLSACNEILVRAKDEQELLSEVCAAIIREGGYRMCWVGYAMRDGSKLVRPVAKSGYEDGYLDGIRVTWDEGREARGPMGSAITSGRPSIFREIAINPAFEPWRPEALRRGYQSVIGLPLASGSGTGPGAGAETFGALGIYASQPDAFDEAEVRLLTELANDLSFGIASLRAQWDRERLEEQLRHAQKMEAVGTLAGGVAHDFNNILTAIVGYTQVTLMKLSNTDPLRHNLEQVMESARRASSLTQSLLAFSRKQPVKTERLDVNELTRRFEKFLRRLIREDVDFEARYAGEDLPVLADRGQIEQVLMNLVTNARDALPRGGHLFVETGTARLDDAFIKSRGYGAAGDYAVISVADTGIGMDEKTREKIFEPFFTTKEQGKGTGLGLAMVYGIVRKHNGFIEVASEPGKGTLLEVYLPLERTVAGPPHHNAGASAPIAPEAGGTETILIAEDDETLRNLSAMVLRQYGYEVIEAADGEEAVRKFEARKDRVSLALLDGVMPKKNGRDVYEEIRRIAPRVKTVFLSGYAEGVLSAEYLREQGLTLILKPVTPRELARAVREAIDREGPAD